jgi:molybdopterin-biosynthesis enzyme MoeA-like protein
MTSAFSLIIVGDEILSGKRADKHLSKVIEILAARGLALDHAEYVGDDPQRITAALTRAFEAANQGDIVFSTGGIGATPDDHTRQCAAVALGRPLALHPQAEALIRERMQDVAREQGKPYEPDRPDNIHRLNMGVFPQGAEIIPNPYNKIPGFSIVAERGGSVFRRAAPEENAPPRGAATREAAERGGCHFFPGFPVMAWPMMEWVLDTRYSHLFQQNAWAERSVIVYGQMEATLTPLMEQLERDFAPVKVFSLPSVDHPQHGRHIELGVKLQVGTDVAAAHRLADAYAALKDGLVRVQAKVGPEMVR